MALYLQDWGKALKDNLIQREYADFVKQKKQKLCSTYIFSDLERVHANNVPVLQSIWKQLHALPHPCRLLNNPEKVLKRLPLLQTLHQKGINSFNAYPILEGQNVYPKRFPVFIREANDHKGPLSGLIETQTELNAEIERLRQGKALGPNPMVTEYIPCTDTLGMHKKFSAYRIGEQIIPAPMGLSKHWMVKIANSDLTENLFQEEWKLMQTNPHQAELLKIFNLAHIDYGRIDYGFSAGRLQVFEINTNPHLVKPGRYPEPLRQRNKAFLALKLIKAFTHLDLAI